MLTGSPIGAGEDKLGLAKAKAQPFGGLLRPMGLQGFNRQRRKGDHAAAGLGLWRLERGDRWLANVLKGLIDRQLRPAKVNVAPTQAEDFAPSHSACDRQ
jgi:hypothetical protein